MFKRRFRKYAYKKPYTILRYFILVLTAGILLLGGVYVLTILDPYSTFGRFMTYFAKPVVLVVNNLLASLFGKFDIYTLFKVDIKAYELAAYAIPAGVPAADRIFSIQARQALLQHSLPCGNISWFPQQDIPFQDKI